MKRSVSRVARKVQESHLDRRKTPRVEASLVVHVTALAKDGTTIDYMTGKTVDLSEGGMRLLLFHHSLGVGSRVRLSFNVSQTLVEAVGTVVYVDPVGGFGMGIKFEKLSAVSARAIAAATAKRAGNAD